MANIEKIEDNGKLLAIIVRGDNYENELMFPTPNELPFQLGLHNQKKGKIIPAHQHIPIEKIENLDVSEVFYIKKGKAKISIYNKEKEKLKEVIASGGDIIYLLCGHGIEFLEDTIMFEIKQGPYRSKEKEKEMI